jgi:hypothetical protein
MRITYLFAVIFFFFILPLSSAALCQSINPITNVPCDIITPVLSCSSAATLTNLNTSQSYSLPMSSMGDGTYKIIFNYGIAEYLILLCDNTTSTFSVQGVNNLPPVYYPKNPTTTAGSRTNVRDINYTIAVQFSQYPYVDINQTTSIYVEVQKNMTSYGNLTTTMYITEVNGSISEVNVPYNGGNGIYQVSLLFDKVGNYPFVIRLNGTGIDRNITTGTLLVRQPYFIYVELYNKKDLSAYKNNYGYVTVEYASGRQINTQLEPFFYPLITDYYKNPVFHAPYIDGQARVKLFDNATTYLFRFMDDVTFNATYAKPTPLSTTRTEMYLGSQYVNNTTTYQFVLTEKDKYPYRWLLNWGMLIALVLVGAGAAAFFFVIPEKPLIALVFGGLFTVLILGGRLVIFVLRGW